MYACSMYVYMFVSMYVKAFSLKGHYYHFVFIQITLITTLIIDVFICLVKFPIELYCLLRFATIS